MQHSLSSAKAVRLPPRPHLQVREAIHGDVTAETVTVHSGAAVHGRIAAGTVVIRGVVRGSVDADTIQISQTGKIEGDLHYRVLAVAPGAEIVARCVPGRRRLSSLDTSGQIARRRAG